MFDCLPKCVSAVYVMQCHVVASIVVYGLSHGMGKHKRENHLGAMDTPAHQYMNKGHGLAMLPCPYHIHRAS